MSSSNITMKPPPYTASQLQAIGISERVGSAFSLLACILMILTFSFSKRFRRPVNRIMFYAACSNLLYTIPGLIALDALYGDGEGAESGLCQAQAFFVQAFLPADALWNLSMALNVYFTVFRGNDMERLHKREPWYIAFNFIFPFVIAIILLAVTTQGRARVYAGASIWCWISTDWEWLRILTCYGIAWVCIATAFAIYIAAGMRIRRERLQLLRPSIENGHYGESHLATYDIVAQTTVQTTIATEESQPPATAISIEPTKTPGYKPSNRTRYQVHVSATGRKPETTAYSDPVRKYTKSCVLFFISLLITWVPSSINRVYSLATNGQPAPFGLAFTAAFVLQLTGFWNSIVYFSMSRAACKDLIKIDILPRLRRENSKPKTPLIRRSTTGEELSTRVSRRGSLDTFVSGFPSANPTAPPIAKTTSSSSRTEINSAEESVTDWDWDNKKSLD